MQWYHFGVFYSRKEAVLCRKRQKTGSLGSCLRRRKKESPKRMPWKQHRRPPWHLQNPHSGGVPLLLDFCDQWCQTVGMACVFRIFGNVFIVYIQNLLLLQINSRYHFLLSTFLYGYFSLNTFCMGSFLCRTFKESFISLQKSSLKSLKYNLN